MRSALDSDLPDQDLPDQDRDQPESAGAVADVARVRALLVAAARRGTALTYADVLDRLGHRFTRPKMRVLCRTLDAIDAAGAAAGEPALAVLVVREADGLPGQGWWTGNPIRLASYDGPWAGPAALAFVAAEQTKAFRFWRKRPANPDPEA